MAPPGRPGGYSLEECSTQRETREEEEEDRRAGDRDGKVPSTVSRRQKPRPHGERLFLGSWCHHRTDPIASLGGGGKKSQLRAGEVGAPGGYVLPPCSGGAS